MNAIPHEEPGHAPAERDGAVAIRHPEDHFLARRHRGEIPVDRGGAEGPAVRPQFTVRYTADVALLAATDAAHEDLSGPALCHILGREFQVFGNQQYQRLAGLSVSHLYNLRNSPRYRKPRVKFHHTQASKVSIGERRKPDPKGKPGYLRIDTVHQGRKDGQEGIFFINSVDTVPRPMPKWPATSRWKPG